MGSYLVRIAEAKYLIGDDDAALRFALKALAQPSFQWSRYAILIAALGQLGRLEEAQRYLAEVARARPNFAVAFVRTLLTCLCFAGFRPSRWPFARPTATMAFSPRYRRGASRGRRGAGGGYAGQG